jgi:D-glycero-D-manno-heptose 1,7-bisphosphate phosphatase
MSALRTKPAVFLDRDGVIIEDVDLLVDAADIRVLTGVPEALAKLRQHGFELLIISNQTVIARGLATEEDVNNINQELNRRLIAASGAGVDSFYVCPHHPKATLDSYRVNCDCRKPKPGLILRAAKEHDLDLARSFAVGDRITDIIAGARAGCRTVLVKTGRHDDPPIETSEPIDQTITPDWTCADLAAAADWILKRP